MKFAKLEATGNDFIIIDVRGEQGDWGALARETCRYHFGIGADGLIVLRHSSTCDFGVSFFNSDGSEAEVCGNGLRCLAKYALEQGVTAKARMAVETLSGIRWLEAYLDGGVVDRVAVNMGMPRFKPGEIPATIDGEADTVLDYPVEVAGREIVLSLVSMGNPHAVSFTTEPVSAFPLEEIGSQVENLSMFPQRTNFEIARVLDPGRMEIRIWERGVGETLSCGSGACAVAVIARLHGYTGQETDIMVPGGVLNICWDGEGEVSLAGEVREVFSGDWLK